MDTTDFYEFYCEIFDLFFYFEIISENPKSFFR